MSILLFVYLFDLFDPCFFVYGGCEVGNVKCVGFCVCRLDCMSCHLFAETLGQSMSLLEKSHYCPEKFKQQEI